MRTQGQRQVRISWWELPAAVRSYVEELLDGPVVEAVSQVHGFSPGSADRVRTLSGHRAFVKAVNRDRNAGTWALHRQERAVLDVLPSTVAAPRLLGAHEEGDWIVLVLEDVEGSHPGAQASTADVLAVLHALAALPVLSGTAAAAVLPRADAELAPEFQGWSRLCRTGALEAVPAWVREHVGELEAAAGGGAAAVAGEHLVHLDCRSDNVLLDRGGRVWLIDWPWAGLGARWLDGLGFLLDLRMHAAPVDTDALLSTHRLFKGVAAREVDAVLAGLTGYFFEAAGRPAPPHMPGIRAFQRREAMAGLDWLRARWD